MHADKIPNPPSMGFKWDLRERKVNRGMLKEKLKWELKVCVHGFLPRTPPNLNSYNKASGFYEITTSDVLMRTKPLDRGHESHVRTFQEEQLTLLRNCKASIEALQCRRELRVLRLLTC